MALTGFLVNMGGGNPSVCADSAANAIQALGARFPYVAGSQPLLCSLTSSTFTAPNTFNNTVTCHDLTSNQIYSLLHPLTLMQCDPALPIGGGLALDPINATNIAYVFSWGFGAIVFFFFLGFVIGMAAKAIKEA